MEAYPHFKKAANSTGTLHSFTWEMLTSSLLQNLNGFVLQSGERLTTFFTRLAEVFQELEDLDGEHAMTFTNTQKLTYLLKAIRHEPHLEAARVYLQSEMNR